MTTKIEKIIKQAVEDVNKKYEAETLYEAEQKGMKEGRKEGRKDTQKEIAKKLKGLLTPEQISKITGLDLNTIQLL